MGRVLATPPPIAHHVMLMEDFEPEPAFSSETPRDSLSGKTARGFIWMLGQTVGSKLFSFGTQIALARLLLPRDFGLIALAYTAVALAGVIRQTGIQQILIQRHQQFRRWVNPAFWFEFTVGIATAILLAVASPVAAVVFHSRALIGLILVIAAAAPLSPWVVIPTARLMIDMRFKAIALVNITYNLIAMVISIFLAWKGFGAYSFVVPLPIAGGIRAFWLWQLAKPRVGAKPQFRRWKFLAGDSGLLLATGFLSSIMYQAGSLILGLMYSKAVVGQFFFAFNLSSQVSQLLSQNVLAVLLPTLSRMQHQTQRHSAALLRASRMLGLISIPLSLLLAVVAKPVVIVVYGAKWLPAVPVLQALALAGVAYIPSSPAISAMQSQGRFRPLLLWTAMQTAVYLAAVWVGSRAGGAAGAALAILAYSIVTSPVMIGIALRDRSLWHKIARVYLGPVMAGSIAFVPLGAVLLLWPKFAHQYVLWLGFGVISLALIFPLSAHLFCRSDSKDAWTHAIKFLAARRVNSRREKAG